MMLDKLRENLAEKGRTLLSTKYISAKEKYRVRCEHRHVFAASYDNLMRGRGCPKCKPANIAKRAVAKFRTIQELREFARHHHGGDCFAKQPVSTTEKVPWKCKNNAHEPFLAKPSRVMIPDSGTWCPACFDDRRGEGRIIPLEVVEKYVSKRGGEIVAILGEIGWNGLQTRLTVRCTDKHEWDVTASNLVYAKSWCPYCLNKGELITRAIFEATFEGCKFPKSKPQWLELATGQRLELDGYCEPLGIAFEYQGYHHEKADVKRTDDIKRKACAKNDVKLIAVVGVKRPFPYSNVLKQVGLSFKKYGIRKTPKLPIGEVFPSRLEDLRQLAQQRGGVLVSTVYFGAEKHEWHCGNANHATWFAEPSRIRKGDWCPSCAGNRRLGIVGLREWGREHGLELLSKTYINSGHEYRWRCRRVGHVISRSRGNIRQSVKRGYSACTTCGPGISVNVNSRKAAADRFAHQVMPMISKLKREGYKSLEVLAKQLNERGIPSALGGQWYASTVRSVMIRGKQLGTVTASRWSARD